MVGLAAAPSCQARSTDLASQAAQLGLREPTSVQSLVRSSPPTWATEALPCVAPQSSTPDVWGSQVETAQEYLCQVQLQPTSAQKPVRNQIVNDGPNRVGALARKPFDSEQSRDRGRRSFFDEAELIFD